MTVINWNPVAHIGPIPINWYGLGWVAAFLTGAALVRRWAGQAQMAAADLENLLMWVLVGAFVGARLYFVAQNDAWLYITHPWRIAAVWEGGLAFFGGLFGAIAAAYIYTRRHGLPFGAIADLFAPGVPIAASDRPYSVSSRRHGLRHADHTAMGRNLYKRGQLRAHGRRATTPRSGL
jgi:prolipoprotein diacylglyceryl transferase